MRLHRILVDWGIFMYFKATLCRNSALAPLTVSECNTTIENINPITIIIIIIIISR